MQGLSKPRIFELAEREVLLQKAKEWQNKAHVELDPFNKYFAMCVSYNIFYSLYWKTKNSSADMFGKDSEAATSTIELVSDPESLIHEMRAEVNRYLDLIPMFREEYWRTERSHNRVAISKALKQAIRDGQFAKALEMMIKWLYKVRCNLVHGEKGYNDDGQYELLLLSSTLLDKYISRVITSYRGQFMQ